MGDKTTQSQTTEPNWQKIHFEDAVDALDAAVFSGDGLMLESNRVLLRQMLDRWARKIPDWEKIAADFNEGLP